MKNTFYSLLLFLLILHASNIYSQPELTVGPEITHDEKLNLFKVIGTTDDAVYSIWLNTNGEKGNDEYYLEKYELPSFKLIYSKRIYLGKEPGDQAIIENVELMDKKIVLISSFIRFKEYEFYGQVLDLNGEFIRPLTTINTSERDRYTSFNLSFNGEYVTLNTHHFEDRIHQDKVQVFSVMNFSSVFERNLRDTDLDIEKNFNYGFKYEEKGFFHYLSSSTKIKTINGKKMRVTELSLCYYGASDATANQVLLGDYPMGTLGTINIYVNSLDQLIIGGYRREKDKLISFFSIVDRPTLSVKQKAETSMLLAKDKIKTHYKNGLLNSKKPFEFFARWLYYSNGSLWIIGEQNLYIADQNFVKAYIYDLAVAHFNLNDNTSGMINFPKRELQYRTTYNYSPHNYLFYTNNKDLNVLYFDSEKNLNTLANPSYNAKTLESVKNEKNVKLVLGTVNDKNEINRKIINSPLADKLNFKCRATPNSSVIRRNTGLCDIYKDKQLLVYIKDGKIGHWAFITNY